MYHSWKLTNTPPKLNCPIAREFETKLIEENNYLIRGKKTLTQSREDKWKIKLIQKWKILDFFYKVDLLANMKINVLNKKNTLDLIRIITSLCLLPK